MSSGSLVLCLWSGQSALMLLLWFVICELVQVLFSTDGVNGIMNFKYMSSGSLVLCLWSGQSALMLLLWFVICELVQVLFLSTVLNI